MSTDYQSPIYYTGVERGRMMQEYDVDPAATTIAVGDLVYLDTADHLIKLCGADPALILGWANFRAADTLTGANGLPIGRGLVEVIAPDVEYWLPVVGTLVATDEGKTYGLSRISAGHWGIERAETTATRFRITKVDVTRQIVGGYFVTANLQESTL